MPTDGTRCPIYGKGCPADGKEEETVRVEIDEAFSRRLAMSWEDVAERFPYGLPASLQRAGRRRFLSSNVVDLEQWRQRKKKEEVRRPVERDPGP